MDRERLDQWCEWGILGLVLALLIFTPLATGAVRPQEMLVVQGLTVGILLLWTIRLWVRESHRIYWAPVCWFALAFTIYAVVRYRQAGLEYVARAELVKVLVYSVLFFAVLDNLNRQEYAQILCFTLIILASLISMYAVYQFVTGSPHVWHFIKPPQYGRRGSGTFICPNNLSGYLEMVVPLALAFLFTGRFKPITKVFFGYAALAMLAGIGATISRAGWAVTALALSVFFLLLLMRRNTRLPAIITIIGFIIVVVLFFRQDIYSQQRWKRLFTQSGNLEDVRFHLWKPAIQIWKENPWIGAGPAHFDYRFPAYRPEIVQLRPGRVHNDYLNTLADWGIVGAILVAGAFVSLYWAVAKTLKFVKRANDLTTKPSARGAFILGGGISILAILLHSVVDFNMHIPANAIVVVIVMAMLTGYLRYATERFWFKLGWIFSILGTVAFLGTTGFFAKQIFKGTQECLALNRAEKLGRQAEKDQNSLQTEMDATNQVNLQRVEKLSDQIRTAWKDQIAALEQAYAIEPNNFATTYKIGEVLRMESWQRGMDCVSKAQEAMKWFEEGIKLNPFDPYNYLRYGMCMHMVGKGEEAGKYFDQALERDRKNWFLVGIYAWHYFELGRYQEAKHWFEESIRLSDWRANWLADRHLRLIDQILQSKKAKE